VLVSALLEDTGKVIMSVQTLTYRIAERLGVFQWGRVPSCVVPATHTTCMSTTGVWFPLAPTYPHTHALEHAHAADARTHTRTHTENIYYAALKPPLLSPLFSHQCQYVLYLYLYLSPPRRYLAVPVEVADAMTANDPTSPRFQRLSVFLGALANVTVMDELPRLNISGKGKDEAMKLVCVVPKRAAAVELAWLDYCYRRVTIRHTSLGRAAK
jgi:hypothetical protein